MEETNSCGIATPSKQMSQTERALKLTDENSRMLFDSISLLEKKLEPIMRNPNPCTEGECSKEESFVALAENIRKIGMDFGFANNKIRDLINRLEI